MWHSTLAHMPYRYLQKFHLDKQICFIQVTNGILHTGRLPISSLRSRGSSVVKRLAFYWEFGRSNPSSTKLQLLGP